MILHGISGVGVSILVLMDVVREACAHARAARWSECVSILVLMDVVREA